MSSSVKRHVLSLFLLFLCLKSTNGDLNARIFEFFQCMSAPHACFSLQIENFGSYHLLNGFDNRKFDSLLNDFDHLFGYDGKVRLNHISSLKISSTMTEVKPYAFYSVKSLRNLSLANNYFARIDSQAFVGLSSLEELILSENFIESLPLDVFDNLSNLLSLNLANNKLLVLNLDGFLLNPYLIFLDVTSNMLTTIRSPNGSLSLTTVLLRNNYLNDIFGLQSLEHLESLDVSGNQLDRLNNLEGSFLALRDLDISQNQWECQYLRQILQYFKGRSVNVAIREKKTEVFNSPNVEGIGCSNTVRGTNFSPPVPQLNKNCGRPAFQANDPVQTVRGELPWMVAIYRQQAGSSEFHCTGTLVSKNLVVTAAHCVNVSLADTVLFVGRFNILEWITKNYEPRAPAQFIVHPEYRDLSSDADIALIVMAEPVQFSDFIQPICLPVREQTPSLLVTWERDEFDSLISGSPRKTQLPIVPNGQCFATNKNKQIEFSSAVGKRTICAGGSRWRGPCNVDSGAVTISVAADQRWHLTGVLSTTLPDPGIRYCNLKRFNIFTKVSSFSPWITSYIESNFVN